MYTRIIIVIIIYTIQRVPVFIRVINSCKTGVLPIRRIPILGLGLELGLGFGDSGYSNLEFGSLKFGEIERNRKTSVIYPQINLNQRRR